MRYIVGAYSQIPFGSSREEYDAVLTKQLKPLLTYIYQNPNLKVLLRLGSNMFEFMDQNYPELNMLISDLCRKEQLELLTSSYYDTIINLVPAQERFIPVEKTTTYIRKHFGKKPTGLWFFNQVFNPVVISGMAMSDLNYIVISGYNQILNSVLANKPFYMDEMGKSTIVFPSDDRFSKEIADVSKNHDTYTKLSQNIEKICQSTNNAINTVMLNMDQLASIEDSSGIYKLIYSNLGSNSTLPSEFIKNHELTKSFYIPAGIYGRDFSVGKSTSINQIINNSSMLTRNYNILNNLRDCVKDCKKNTDTKKHLDNLVLQAGCSSLYVPEYGYNQNIRRVSNQCLCEIESLLEENSALPLDMDIDGDRIPEEIISTKNMICYLNTKGAVINRLNILSNFFDLAFNNADGLFSDSLRNSTTSKVVELSSKRFELTSLDKKRQDFFAKCPTIEVEKVPLNITKRFKFRLNTVVVDIGIENLGSIPLKDYLYETDISLSFPDETDVFKTNNIEITDQNTETNSVLMDSKKSPFNIQIFTSQKVLFSSRKFSQKVQTINGEKDFYQYTKLTLQNKFTVNSKEELHFTVALKIDKSTRR